MSDWLHANNWLINLDNVLFIQDKFDADNKVKPYQIEFQLIGRNGCLQRSYSNKDERDKEFKILKDHLTSKPPKDSAL